MGCLSLVFCCLTKHPHEPHKKVSDRDLTFKTLFLLALASAKMVSELHRLLAKVHHSEGWQSLFSSMPDFMAKTQNPSVPDD